MDWFARVDGYCERIGPEYWAEPVNAVTNLAFVIAAVAMWRLSAGVPVARVLSAILGVIGIGSWLFHTHATVWAGVADVVPILAFVLVYIYAINRAAWRMGRWMAVAATALFVPYGALTVPVFAAVPGLGGSAAYAPVPLLIAIYALLLRRREPRLAGGLGLGAGLLVVSLAFRTLDPAVCTVFPTGTHFMWHLANAAMLGWMIFVYLRLRRQS
ncbi:MAG: ceramidase [Rhodobacteraceae bacterium]|nr:ceramidase [Paracoccaceae bacterium]